MTRSEHLAWCKERALAYLPNDLTNAWASMASDINKHPETEHHAALELGMMLQMSGHLSTSAEMADFIKGFK